MIGTKEGVRIVNGRVVTRGVIWELAWGFSAFKLFNYVAQHFAGHGDEFTSLGGSVRGALNIVGKFIEDRQALVGRRDVWFRIFLQTGDGEPGSWHRLDSVEQGMFGSPPHEPGAPGGPQEGEPRLWNYEALRRGRRPESVTGLMANCLEWIFSYSQVSGACFEAVVDATVKHMDGMTPGTVDHMVRQVAIKCRELQKKYPRACVILSTDNEWNAHNRVGTTLSQLNMRARRFYRWKDAGGGLAQSFVDPGGSYEAEQWPEGVVIVDPGGKDFFTYDVGPEPYNFKFGAIHPDRKGNPRDWRDIAPIMPRLVRDSRGMPIAFTESMYYVDNSPESLDRAHRIYRNKNGWHANHEDMMLFYSRWVGNIQYGIIHTEKDVQGSIDWPMERTPLELKLAEFFETGDPGHDPPPPDPDPEPEPVHRYDRIVRLAYRQILDRDPDDGGLAHYNGMMLLGMSEADMREALIRSGEYDEKNP